MGVEPTTSAWEANVLPINYIREPYQYNVLYIISHIPDFVNSSGRNFPVYVIHFNPRTVPRCSAYSMFPQALSSGISTMLLQPDGGGYLSARL